uniref:BED-type domain-containing protein n=1 Tax=Elaeophora elaphi TaxID=1147741 RepID=A0A0R3RNH0_9BILA
MLKSCYETFPTSLDVLYRLANCVNSEKNNSNHSTDNSVADCKNSLSSTKISNLSTSCPAMVIDEEKEVGSANTVPSLSNIGRRSEILEPLVSSMMNILSNHSSDNGVKSGKTKKRKSQKSGVWKHFIRLSNDNVHCILCERVLKRSDSSTKTMWCHLRAKHEEQWIALKQDVSQNSNQPEMNQTDMPSSDELDPSGTITTQNWLEQRVGILCDKPQEVQTTSEIAGQLDNSSPDSFPWLNGKAKKRKSQKSGVWRHFIRLSNDNVHCILCERVLKRSDSSTKTMWCHLRAKHEEQWIALKQDVSQNSNQPEMNQTDMPSSDELDPSGTITTQNWLEQRVGILCDKP